MSDRNIAKKIIELYDLLYQDVKKKVGCKSEVKEQSVSELCLKNLWISSLMYPEKMQKI